MENFLENDYDLLDDGDQHNFESIIDPEQIKEYSSFLQERF